MDKGERVRYKGTVLTGLQAEAIIKFNKERGKRLRETINNVLNIFGNVFLCVGNFGLFAVFSYVTINVLIQGNRLPDWIYFLWIIIVINCMYFAYNYITSFEKRKGC